MPIDYLDEPQNQAFDRIAKCTDNVFVLWWLQGTGKTRIALAAFMESEFHQCVVITRRVAFSSWIDEIEICKLPITVFENDYEMTNCRRIPIKSKVRKRMLLMSAGDLKNKPAKFPIGQMLIVDELYLFSNPKSKRSRMLNNMSLLCSSRLGLSGTIMPARDNFAIWGQLKALNGHHLLGRNPTEFRKRFQEMSKSNWGNVFTNRQGSELEIADLLKERVDTYFPKSRPTRLQIVKVEKTPEQAKAVKSLKELYEHDDKTYNFALQVVHVINGISNGWFVNKENDLVYYKSNKVEMLLNLIDDITSTGEKVVVWCAYHADIARISQDLKIPWVEFTAKVPFNIAQWNAGKVPVVLATEANGASVNHFKDVKYAIYFSINYKLLDMQQSMKRHERKSSNHDGAYYYFLQTRGTIDADIYRMVTESDKTEKEIVLALKKYIVNIA